MTAVSAVLSFSQAALIAGAAIGILGVLWICSQILSILRIKRALSSVPMAPGYNWLLGHVIDLATCSIGPKAKGAWDLMDDWLNSNLGPIVQFRILGTQGVVVKDPLAMKRIFQTRQKVYEKDLSMSYHSFLPILGTGLVTSDGELWQKQRSLIGPALRVEILDDIITIAKDAVDRLTVKLEATRGTGQPVDIEEEFRLLTLQVIGEAVLSLAPDECDRVFPQLYLPVMEEANRRVLHPYRKYLPIPAWFQFRSRMHQLNSFLINFFRERWQARLAAQAQEKLSGASAAIRGASNGMAHAQSSASGNGVHDSAAAVPRRTDILDRIMDQMQASGAVWDAALETQLCYDVKTFLLAGHETSAAMLTWSMYELVTPAGEAPMRALRAEAKAVFGSEEALPSRRAVDGMTYTLAVLKETLRLYSVVPVVVRSLAVEDELCGHKLPAKTMVVCNLQGTHMLYERPRQWLPERFMPGGEYDQFDEAIRTYMFVPFIQGPRNCLGQHMALLEARVVLALLVKRFKFRLAGDATTAGLKHPAMVPVGPLHSLSVYVD